MSRLIRYLLMGTGLMAVFGYRKYKTDPEFKKKVDEFVSKGKDMKDAFCAAFAEAVKENENVGKSS